MKLIDKIFAWWDCHTSLIWKMLHICATSTHFIYAVTWIDHVADAIMMWVPFNFKRTLVLYSTTPKIILQPSYLSYLSYHGDFHQTLLQTRSSASRLAYGTALRS